MIALVLAFVMGVLGLLTAALYASAKSFGSKLGEDVWDAVSSSGYMAVARWILRHGAILRRREDGRPGFIAEQTAHLMQMDEALETGRIRLVTAAIAACVYDAKLAGARESASKRIIDVLAATLLLVLNAPILAAVMVAIKMDDGGPVLIKRKRVGIDGHPFLLLKLRTVYPNAPDMFISDERRFQEDGDPDIVRFLPDPQISLLGRFLRKTSLDELPQLWNVIRGDISLVGPRPLERGEVKLDDKRHQHRLAVRPGITGPSQVIASRELCRFEDWVETDLEYVNTWSLKGDILILARTMLAVIRRRPGP